WENNAFWLAQECGKLSHRNQTFILFNLDNSSGREMMARQVARQFCRLGEVHSLVYGRRASGENGRKLAASTRVGSQSRLMDYLGLSL
ncbi:MAG: hypothetical protein ABIT23_02230, partial [Nitrosospira sp.]